MTAAPAENTTTPESAVSGPRLPETMQAVICHGPENYQLETVAVPTPGAGRGPGQGGGASASAPAT